MNAVRIQWVIVFFTLAVGSFMISTCHPKASLSIMLSGMNVAWSLGTSATRKNLCAGMYVRQVDVSALGVGHHGEVSYPSWVSKARASGIN